MLSLIPLLPLLGFLVNGTWYAFGQAGEAKSKASAGVTGTIATLAIGGSFIVSVICFLRLFSLDPANRMLEEALFNWINVGNHLKLPMVLRIDQLTALFTLVITGVGTLIHVFSIGYMGHDKTPGKFFAYLNLFCFAMLMLVMGGSLPITFLGWEGVGLCSYLLIGYWYTDIEKAKAGKKAFVVNRIGDLGFLLAMFMIFQAYGTLDFAGLRYAITGGHPAGAFAGASPAEMTAICLLLFLGCCGKSAQFPLYVWLPDAMAGPTPVSALIHAATMVTSGIYLIARLNFMFILSPTALAVIAGVGVFTAFFAATMAIAQRDIKKVLAYSTVSQLGYMFLACGVGAFTAGVFHVITHAFFKALMFLGAGSVIHGMHEEQDIWKMGGLKKHMPQTYLTFAAGWLAICGILPFAGFFSKDEILWEAFASPYGSVVLWAIGFGTAMLTAFYMTRLFTLTFLGKERFDPHHVHPHESPMSMVVPLQILAVLSIVGGFMGIPHLSWISHFLEPLIPAHPPMPAGHEGAHHVAPALEWVLMALSLAGAAAGIFFGLKLYSNLGKVAELQKRFLPVHRLLENKWYVDEVYDALIVRPIGVISNLTWRLLDVGVIDRIVVGFGRASAWSGQTLRVIQTGSIQVYAMMLLVGVLLSVGYLIYGMA
jgi:NADH-quinone oxidoreductase subunit L